MAEHLTTIHQLIVFVVVGTLPLRVVDAPVHGNEARVKVESWFSTLLRSNWCELLLVVDAKAIHNNAGSWSPSAPEGFSKSLQLG